MKIACPGCHAPYTVPDEAVGKKTRCKICGHSFAITAPPPAEEPFVPELIEEPAPTAPAPVMVTLQPVSSLQQHLIFAGVLALAAGALIIVLFFILGHQATRNPNITHENYQKLQGNMTLAEVEAVLGRGTKLESPEVPFYLLENGRKLDATEWYRWRNGANTIHVGLNGPESPPRVAALHWSVVTPAAGGIVDETSEAQYGRARAFVRLPPTEIQPEPKPKVAITKEIYHRIQHGMTEAEVVAVLGPPSHAEEAGDFAAPDTPAMPGKRMRWLDVDAGKYIIVGLMNGRVTAKMSSEGPASIQGFKGELDPKTGLPKLPAR